MKGNQSQSAERSVQNEKSKTPNEGRPFAGRHAALFFALSFALCALRYLPGCGAFATTQPSSMNDRQGDALKDPMGYKPAADPGDISGGDIGNFDKNAFNRDLDNALNP